ncbi:HAMP domain-containing sensor histidine kinase [Psychrobacillus sp. BL-248-WT-3]|uniref:sensor histidine kinase n=1 Tax=Psychrobacillus sp. BL-248-WT-3 TaxID=2725306 RepID=UPI00146B0DB6|nr:HAMP domain-containing sensor histidine kinase [Psychrobacillus sp. BL-248-WT-3]NME06016.1 HAMP domain-containing histidine kinase [Psychrobacillus sp. BL-248-WT-3]
MRQLNWLPSLHQSRQWILLLCVNSGFFIFLAWVAYPESFKLLILTMLIFTFVTILIGVLFTWKKQRKQRNTFYKFLREPSAEHEAKLLQVLGDIHKEPLHDLANQLRHLSDDLQDAKYQSKEYETFIESWVHEIKTPLSLLLFVLQNRQDEMSPLVYQRLNHANITIHDHVERILFYAKLQAAHVDYSLKKVSIVECFEDVLLELQSLLEEQHVLVHREIKDIPVVSDERVLHFILIQLLVNAIKYRNVNSESFIWIETGFDHTKDSYYVKVADNGLGVLQSDLPFIFDKGFTGDASNQKRSTGLGLFLVKKLCDNLQIEIEVKSEHKRGFTIQLLFPKV